MGAGGAVIIIDSGIGITVCDLWDEYYSGVLSEDGETEIYDLVISGRDTEGGPDVYLIFDNSEASSAYRKVSYSATVYTTE